MTAAKFFQRRREMMAPAKLRLDVGIVASDVKASLRIYAKTMGR
jgi:hypothetical protein